MDNINSITIINLPRFISLIILKFLLIKLIKVVGTTINYNIFYVNYKAINHYIIGTI